MAQGQRRAEAGVLGGAGSVPALREGSGKMSAAEAAPGRISQSQHTVNPPKPVTQAEHGG